MGGSNSMCYVRVKPLPPSCFCRTQGDSEHQNMIEGQLQQCCRSRVTEEDLMLPQQHDQFLLLVLVDYRWPITCIQIRISKKLYPVSIATKPFPSLCPCLCCPNFRHRISHSGIMANASLPARSFCWSVIHTLKSTKISVPPSNKSSKGCLCWLNWSNTASSFCLPSHLPFSQHKQWNREI